MSAAPWRWICQRRASLSDLRRVTQIAGTSSSRSPSAPAGWWRRQTAWKARNLALHERPRFFFSRLSQTRHFGTAQHGQQQRQQATKQQHLYLVLLDDQEPDLLDNYYHTEFSIHKLDIDNDELDVGGGGGGSGSVETPLHLSDPPAVRLESGHGAQFAAVGTYIIATCPSTNPRRDTAVTITYDTDTLTFGLSDVLPRGLQRHGYDAAIAEEKRLYVFGSSTHKKKGGFHCLAADACDKESWTWRPLSDASPFLWSWNNKPPGFPFDPKSITAHAVHPRTGTIFVSAFGLRHGSWGTYSYGTGGSGQWKRRGDWMLPFKGHAHYDHELDAWVGLHLPLHHGKKIEALQNASNVKQSVPN
ncbi:hypothetical protein ACQ4PT_056999 [Festuca glaucescens]